MRYPPLLANEPDRLQALHALDLLDTAAEPVFEHITRLLARSLRVPIALVSLVDADRQWFKSCVGLDVCETPREFAFCAHAIAQQELMVVENATLDERFRDNPLVTGEPNIRFYAAVVVRTSSGHALGTLCAIDTTPRTLTQDERDTLSDLAGLVSVQIQQREAIVLSRQQVNHSMAAIEASEARFRTIFEKAPVGIALVAQNGAWMRVNDALCAIVGYSFDELAQLTFQDITHPEDLDKDLSLLRQLVAGEIEHYQLEKRYLRKDGSTVWIDLAATKQVSALGELEYFVAIVTNIQARKEAEASLAGLHRDLEGRVNERTRELRKANEMLSYTMTQQRHFEQALLKREAELSAVIENANDAYVCIDHAGVVSAWNRQAQDTFGWTSEEAIGRLLDELIIPQHLREAHRSGMKRYLGTGETKVLNRRLELPAIRKDGSQLPVEVRIRALDLDGQKIFSAFLHDITERKRAEEARDYEALHDALTGKSNRRALFELLPIAIARSNRSGNTMALLFLDLDGFKAVNDTLGHEAGDCLLQVIACRLSDSVRQTDSVARLAGDEFVVVLEGLLFGLDDAQSVAEKLLIRVQEPVLLGAKSAQVTASIGIALHSSGGTRSAEQLLKAADMAMYEAKRDGKSRICVL